VSCSTKLCLVRKLGRRNKKTTYSRDEAAGIARGEELLADIFGDRANSLSKTERSLADARAQLDQEREKNGMSEDDRKHRRALEDQLWHK